MHPLLAQHGVAAARDLRSVRNQLPGLLKDGSLVQPLPGVYAVTTRAHETATRIRAAQLWQPRGVIIGQAARAVFDVSLAPHVVDIAVVTGAASKLGVRVHRTVVPDVFEHGGLRLAPGAWNALWLAAEDGGEAIDDFLRRGGSRPDLADAMSHFNGMRGTNERRRLLAETAADSWSLGERSLHRLLRADGLEGWRANVSIRTSDGAELVVDVVFRRERVIIEFDGWRFHSSRDAFETDRARQDALCADGWLVLRFTWRQVHERPDWVRDVVRRTLAGRRAAAA